jgi:hypothetical protein
MVKRSSIRLLRAWILATALLTAVTVRAGEPDVSQSPVPTTTTSKDVALPPAQLPLAMQIRLVVGVVLSTLGLP